MKLTWLVLNLLQTFLQMISADLINNTSNENFLLNIVANLPKKKGGNLIFLQDNFTNLLPKLSQIIAYSLLAGNSQYLLATPRNCIILSTNTADLNNHMFSYSTCIVTVVYGIVYNASSIKKLLENQTNSAIIIPIENSTGIHLKTPYTQFEINEKNRLLLKKILEKPPVNLNKKSVRVTMFPKRFTSVKIDDEKFVGFDGDILSILEERLNFSTVMIKNDGRYGYQHPNGNFSGLLGDVIHGKADLATNSIFIKYYNSNDIQFTTVVMLEELCITVPASEMIPQWMVVFLCFEPEVWFGILLTYTIGGILWQKLVNDFGKPKKLHINSSTTWLTMAKIILQMSVNGYSKCFWQRIYLLSLILGSMVLTKCLEGSLLDKLTRNSYWKEISSLEELGKSPLKLYTLSENLRRDTFLKSNKLQSKFYVYKNVSEDLVQLVYRRKDVAYVGRKIDLIRRIGEIRSNPRAVHIIEECPRSYHLGYLLRKDSHLYRPINTLLGRLLAVGIIDRLQNKYINATMAKQLAKKFRKNQRKFQPVKLRLQNLTIGLLVLVFGYTVSSLVFIGELLVKRILGERDVGFAYIN